MNVFQKILAGTGIVVTGLYLVPTEPNEPKTTLPETKNIESVNTLQNIPIEEPSQANFKESIPLIETKVETPKVETPKVIIPIKEKTVLPLPVINNDSQCHESYGGCLKKNAGDYDCAGGSGNGPNYTGKVRVFGYDEFGLDRDKDGWGCE